MENIPQLEQIKKQFSILIEKYSLVAELIDHDKDVGIYTFSLSNPHVFIKFEGERYVKDMFGIRIYISKYPKIPIVIDNFYYYLGFNVPQDTDMIKVFHQHASFLDKYYNNIFLGNFSSFDKLIVFSIKKVFYVGLSHSLPKNSHIRTLRINKNVQWIHIIEEEFYKRRYSEIETYLHNTKSNTLSPANLDLLKTNKKKIVDNIFEYVCNEDNLLNINRNEERISRKFRNNDLSWIDEVLDFINKKNNA